MTKRDKRWLVIADYFRGEYKKSKLETTIWPLEFSKFGCVWAESEQEALDRGRELLGLEITSAIPLDEIRPGWIYGEE